TTAQPEGQVKGTATDATGNTSPEATLDYTVDAGDPDTADTTPPAAPTATVADPDGNSVTGTAEPGSTVTIKDENGTVLGTATADPDGNYAVPMNPALTDGEVVTATATDATGNESDGTDATAPDTTAPEAPTITSIVDDVDLHTGSIVDNAIINDKAPVMTVGLPASGLIAGDQVLVYVNGVVDVIHYLGQTEIDNGELVVNFFGTSVSESEREFEISVSLKDQMGNESEKSDPFNFTVDTTSPTGSISIDDNFLIAGETAEVTFTFSEAVSNFDLTDIAVDPYSASLSGLTTSDGGTTWTATLTPEPGVESIDDVMTVNISDITDLAGNPLSDSIDSDPYSVDTIRPTVEIEMAKPQVALDALDGGQEDRDQSIARISDDGSFAVVWTSLETDNADRSVFVQRFNSNGNAVGEPDKLEAPAVTDLDDATPTITGLNGDGSFVVSWSGKTVDAGGTNNYTSVFVQKFNANGGPDGPPHQLDGIDGPDAQAPDTQPQITTVGTDGSYAVTWSVGYSACFVQLFDADNNPKGPQTEMDLDLNGPANNGKPVIDALGDSGGYVVAWNEHGTGGNGYTTYAAAQRFDADGNPIDATPVSTVFHTPHAITPLHHVDVAGHSDGSFALSWRDSAGGSFDWNTYYQLFDATGAPGTVVTAGSPGGAWSSVDTQIVAHDAGGYILAWRGEDADGDLSIHVRKIAADGTTSTDVVLEHPDGALVNEGAFDVSVNDDTGEFVVSFTSSNKAFAQRFDADGVKDGDIEQLNDFYQPGMDDIHTEILDAAGTLAATWDARTDGADDDTYVGTFGDGDLVITAGDTMDVTFTFSEKVILEVSDITAENGTISNLATADDGITWTATFTASANILDATNIITFAAPDGVITDYVVDTAGNGLAADVESSNYGVEHVFNGTAADDIAATTGTPTSETIHGGEGDDTITGNGGYDILLGGEGNDDLIINADNIDKLGSAPAGGSDEEALGLQMLVDGGNGFDTLQLDGAGIALDLTTIATDPITNIELIDITGSGANQLTLGNDDIIAIGTEDDGNGAIILRIEGDGNDTVTATGFIDNGTATDAVTGNTYNEYLSTAAPGVGESILWIDTQITNVVI
ncbi:MAG: Ig-like domain-containing protein, partial [Candidatus Sedimenticola sp. 20ELBAFRAG]